MDPISYAIPKNASLKINVGKDSDYRIDASDTMDQLLDRKIISTKDPTITLPVSIRILRKNLTFTCRKQADFQMVGSAVYYILGYSFFEKYFPSMIDDKSDLRNRIEKVPNDFDFQMRFDGLSYDELILLQEDVIDCLIQSTDPDKWAVWEKKYQGEILSNVRSKQIEQLWADPFTRKRLIINYLFIQKKGQSGFTPEDRFSTVGFQVEGGWDVDLCFVETLETKDGLYSTESLKIKIHEKGRLTLDSPFGDKPFIDYVQKKRTPINSMPTSEAEWLRLIAIYSHGEECTDPLWEEKSIKEMLRTAKTSTFPVPLYVTRKIFEFSKKHLKENPDLTFCFTLNACESLRGYVDNKLINAIFQNVLKKVGQRLNDLQLHTLAQYGSHSDKLHSHILCQGTQKQCVNYPSFLQVPLDRSDCCLRIKKPFQALTTLPLHLSLEEMLAPISSIKDFNLKVELIKLFSSYFMEDRWVNITMGIRLFYPSIQYLPHLAMKIYLRMASFLSIEEQIPLLKKLLTKKGMLKKNQLVNAAILLIDASDIEKTDIKHEKELCQLVPFLLPDNIDSARTLLEKTEPENPEYWLQLLPHVYQNNSIDSFALFHQSLLRIFSSFNSSQFNRYFDLINQLSEEEKGLLDFSLLNIDSIESFTIGDRLRYVVESIEIGHFEIALVILQKIELEAFNKKQRNDVKNVLLYFLNRGFKRPNRDAIRGLRLLMTFSLTSALFHDDPFPLIIKICPILKGSENREFWKLAKPLLELLFKDREWKGTAPEAMLLFRLFIEEIHTRPDLTKLGFQVLKKYGCSILEAISKSHFSVEVPILTIQWMNLLWGIRSLAKSKGNVVSFLANCKVILEKDPLSPHLHTIHHGIQGNCLDNFEAYKDRYKLLELLYQSAVGQSKYALAIDFLKLQSNLKKRWICCRSLLPKLNDVKEILILFSLALECKRRHEEKVKLIESQLDKFDHESEALDLLNLLPRHPLFRSIAEQLVKKHLFKADKDQIEKYIKPINEFDLFLISILNYLLDQNNIVYLTIFTRVIEKSDLVQDSPEKKEPFFEKLLLSLCQMHPQSLLNLLKNPVTLNHYFKERKRVTFVASQIPLLMHQEKYLKTVRYFFHTWMTEEDFPFTSDHIDLLLQEKNKEALQFLLQLFQRCNSLFTDRQKDQLFSLFLHHPQLKGDTVQEFLIEIIQRYSRENKIPLFLSKVEKRSCIELDYIKALALKEIIHIESSSMISKWLNQLFLSKCNRCLMIIAEMYFHGYVDKHLENDQLLDHLEYISCEVIKRGDRDNQMVKRCYHFIESDHFMIHLRKYFYSDRYFQLVANLMINALHTPDFLSLNLVQISGSIIFTEIGLSSTINKRVFVWSKAIIKAIIQNLKDRKLNPKEDRKKILLALKVYKNHFTEYRMTSDSLYIYRNLHFFSIALDIKGFNDIITETNKRGFLRCSCKDKLDYKPEPGCHEAYYSLTIESLLLQFEDTTSEIAQFPDSQLVGMIFYKLCFDLIKTGTPSACIKACTLLGTYSKYIYSTSIAAIDYSIKAYKKIIKAHSSCPTYENLIVIGHCISSLFNTAESLKVVNAATPENGAKFLKLLDFCTNGYDLIHKLPFKETAKAMEANAIIIDQKLIRTLMKFFQTYSIIAPSNFNYIIESELTGAKSFQDILQFQNFFGDLTLLEDMFFLHKVCLKHAELCIDDKELTNELSMCFSNYLDVIHQLASKKKINALKKYFLKDAALVLEISDPSKNLKLYKHFFPKALVLINKFIIISGKVNSRNYELFISKIEKILYTLFQMDESEKEIEEIASPSETIEKTWLILSNSLEKETKNFRTLHSLFNKMTEKLKINLNKKPLLQ